jgi:hypothetical protein
MVSDKPDTSAEAVNNLAFEVCADAANMNNGFPFRGEIAQRAQSISHIAMRLAAERDALQAEIADCDKACAEWSEVSQRNYQRAKAAEAQLAKAREGLSEISRQKKTDELETEYDVEVASFDDGYDMCMD